MEVVLLAGGLGTRLHEVTKDRLPKCLALVNDKPFLHYLIDFYLAHGATRFIFALSHHAQMVIDNVNNSYPNLDCEYSVESTPLGTGGAIKQALTYCKEEQVLVINADSFVEYDLKAFIHFANHRNTELSIVCTKVNDISRFGAANIDDDNNIKGFLEKGRQGEGFINAGVYLIKNRAELLAQQTKKFSFEEQVLANNAYEKSAYKTGGLFFDIGTPSDYEGSQRLVSLNQQIFGNVD